MLKELQNIKTLNDISSRAAKVTYKISDDGNDFIFKEFDKTAEKIESINASSILGKKVTEVFPGIKEFGLFDVFHQVFESGISAIHPISLYKDNAKHGWRRNIVVKTANDELTVWYEDSEVEYQNHQSLEIFKQILRFSSDAVAITDAKANILYINDTFINNTGYTRDELINTNINILKSGEHNELYYKDMWTTLTHYEIWEDEMINRHKDGSHYIDHTIIIPIYTEDKVITNYVTIKKDVTDLKLKEQIYRNHIREAQMGEMISIIAHQWKQPLATISATNNALSIKSQLNKEITAETIQEHHQTIEHSITSMVETMDDFRNFYSPNQTEIDINLKKLVKESIKLIHNAIKTHNVTINIHVNEGMSIKTYKNEIKQVFINLIKNFLDVVDEREISSPFITINAIEDQEHVRITVQDNGGGIADKNIDKIFAPYFTTKTDEKGTGLGLYMSKLVIEEHCNGTISVENSNDGALFTILLQKL